MQNNIKKDCLKRMRYLSGHLDGVCRMIEDGRYCIDIIQQNLGVISALHKVNEKFLLSHLEHCVTSAVKNSNKKARKQVFKEILEIYKNKR